MDVVFIAASGFRQAQNELLDQLRDVMRLKRYSFQSSEAQTIPRARAREGIPARIGRVTRTRGQLSEFPV